MLNSEDWGTPYPLPGITPNIRSMSARGDMLDKKGENALVSACPPFLQNFPTVIFFIYFLTNHQLEVKLLHMDLCVERIVF